ncbi:MAG: LacI family DNA-binding transcriptional regulator [bacterium]|nr:LacI family DNA-binding transcriptional regulator [bacterium]
MSTKQLKKKVTQKDIARKLGVSRTVVSYALNERPDGHGNVTMRPDLRQKIRQVASDMGYKQDKMATALREGRSGTIGIITAYSDSQITTRRTNEICRHLEMHGYDYSLQMVSYDDESGWMKRFEKVFDLLECQRVDGFIVHQLFFDGEASVTAEQRLLSAGRPVVLVSSYFSRMFPIIGPDYFNAGYQLAKHILSQDRRKLAAISKQPDNIFSIAERFRGIQTAVDEVPGASLHWIRFSSDDPSVITNELRAGFLATDELLSAQVPEAIFYTNDLMACGGLSALTARGIRIPEDVAITGFDGINFSGFTQPPLTTAEQPVGAIAQKTVETLVEMIGDFEYRPVGITSVPCNIIFRASSG